MVLRIVGNLTNTNYTVAGPGNASEPSFRFTDDSTTGMYYSGFGTLAFATSGEERMTLNASGLSVGSTVRVGVGSAFEPSYCFTVNSATGMYYSGFGALAFVTSGEDRMTLSADGNVGISTTAPEYTLDINGTARISSDVICGGVVNLGSHVQNNLLCLYGNSIDPSATNVFGFGIDSNTLRYSVDSAGAQHAFYGNTTLFGNITANGLATSAITVANVKFTSNATCQLYLAAGNVITSSTNMQTPGGLVTALNTSTAQTGVAFVHALACTLHSASAAGVSTGLVNPGILSFIAADALSYYKTTAAIYDFWRTYVNLVAGTYTFRLHCGVNTDRGIVTVVLNSTTVGTIDLYASLSDSLKTVAGIVVATSGVYKLELQVNSKNASSTNYYFGWRAASFIRTA